MLFGAASVPVGLTQQREREQVLWLIASITTMNRLLIAHILMVNADPIGLGNSFEGTATHLMLADSIDKKVKSKRTLGGTSFSSALTGRGPTGVNIC